MKIWFGKIMDSDYIYMIYDVYFLSWHSDLRLFLTMTSFSIVYKENETCPSMLIYLEFHTRRILALWLGLLLS